MEDYPLNLMDFGARFHSEPGRDRLRGQIELDEAYIGGPEEGLRGCKIENKSFRFNRWKSHHRGKLFYRLMQQAVAVEETPYRKIVASKNNI